jgi:putative membrane protein
MPPLFAFSVQPGRLFLETLMGLEWLKPAAFLGSILFALIGVIIFWLSFIIIDKMTPYDLWQEIVEKQNMALAVVVAAMALGICVIVAAAIHG